MSLEFRMKIASAIEVEMMRQGLSSKGIDTLRIAESALAAARNPSCGMMNEGGATIFLGYDPRTSSYTEAAVAAWLAMIDEARR